jgi:hypothetical protein
MECAGTYQPPPQPTTPPTTLARPLGFPSASPSVVDPNQERSLIDVGLLLGRTSRVGWGTNGRFIHTGVIPHDREKRRDQGRMG